MRSHRPAFGFIFVTVLLDMLGFGIIAPILPGLIEKLLHGDVGRTSQYMGLFVSTWALMQFFCSPILGVLSDRYGRRPVILLSNFGLGLDYFVMALAPTVGWLFLGRVLSGITSSSMATANAYVTDITAPEKRARAFGLLGAAFGVGFVLGPAMGGWMGSYNPRLPFWVAGALSLMNALYGFIILPESLAPEHRQRTIRWKLANPLASLKLLRSHRELFALTGINMLGYLAHEVYATVFVLYTMYRYGWSEKTVGMSLAVVGISYMITSATLVGPFVKRFGERHALFSGLLFGALGFALFGLATTGWLFLVAIAVNSLWGLAGAPAQSLMTRHVSVAEQGQLQGALSSLRGMAMIVGPGLFAGVFAISIKLRPAIPGAPWFRSALFLVSSVILAHAVIPVSGSVPRPESTAQVPAAEVVAEVNGADEFDPVI
ncbi:MAG: TCR/Tet family MFS transporter [Gemmatimonadaceae bacterium]